MKKLLLSVALVAASCVFSKAQEAPPPKDSISIDSVAVVKPIFSENDNNLIDSIGSIVQAANDAETKAVLNDAITTIKNTPKGGGIDDWVIYLLGVVGVIFGAYQYIRRRWSAKPIQDPPLKNNYKKKT